MPDPKRDEREHLTVPASRGLTVTRVPVKIKLFEITEEQLDSLAYNDYNLGINLAAASLGVGLTAFVAWVTAEFKATLARELFTAAWMAFFVLALILSYAGYRGLKKHREQIKRIKGE